MRLLPLILCVTALSGCTTVGPDFAPPASPTATAYQAPGERGPTAIGGPAAGTWPPAAGAPG